MHTLINMHDHLNTTEHATSQYSLVYKSYPMDIYRHLHAYIHVTMVHNGNTYSSSEVQAIDACINACVHVPVGCNNCSHRSAPTLISCV